MDPSLASGLIYLGNTCYINAALQAFFSIPIVTDQLKIQFNEENRAICGGENIVCLLLERSIHHIHRYIFIAF